jgi:ABC-type nickel/cobalt efflux system permease component RcnA
MALLLRLPAALVTFLALSAAATAHPLGNFTVNHLDRLTLTGTVAHVRYVLDEAEIPSFAVLRSLDRTAMPGDAALERWARDEARRDAKAIVLTADGAPVDLALGRVAVATRPGAGGLRTISMTAELAAPLPRAARRLVLVDRTYPGRIGWRDVVIDRESEPTGELRSYPNALLGSPRDRTARVAMRTEAGQLRAEQDDVEQRSAGTSIARMDALAQTLQAGAGSPWAVLGALVLALGLGALHALEPGHGKTLLAVSLVGARATAPRAVVLAAALTAAHTAGVLALGVIVLLAAHWVVPETIYPWLTLLSGALVTAIGARALKRQIGHRHHHHHHRNSHVQTVAPLTFRAAVVAAATGNLAPCPAALVVLLAAVSLHRVAYGLVLIVAFGLGLALVLTGLGLAVVRGASWLSGRRAFARATSGGPLVIACVISLAGSVLVAQGFTQAGIATPAPVVAALVASAIAGYAYGGHRHRHIGELPQGERA